MAVIGAFSALMNTLSRVVWARFTDRRCGTSDLSLVPVRLSKEHVSAGVPTHYVASLLQQVYSDRSATSGSTREARYAGMPTAMVAIRSIAPADATSEAKSVDEMPNT